MSDDRSILWVDENDLDNLDLGIDSYLLVCKALLIGIVDLFDVVYEREAEINLRSFYLELFTGVRCKFSITDGGSVIEITMLANDTFSSKYVMKCTKCKYTKNYTKAAGLKQFFSFHECR